MPELFFREVGARLGPVLVGGDVALPAAGASGMGAADLGSGEAAGVAGEAVLAHRQGVRDQWRRLGMGAQAAGETDRLEGITPENRADFLGDMALSAAHQVGMGGRWGDAGSLAVTGEAVSAFEAFDGMGDNRWSGAVETIRPHDPK